MRRLYTGAALTSLQPLVLSVLMLPATAFVIRGLGPAAYGQWMTASALVGFLMVTTNLGLRVTFVRSVARSPEQAAEAFADQLGARLCLAAGAAAIALLLCVALGYSSVVLVCTGITALGLVLTAVANTASDLLRGFQRLEIVAAANMLSGVVLQTLAVVAVVMDLGPIGVAFAYLAGPVVSIGFLVWLITRQYFSVSARFDLGRLLELFWEARHMAGQSLIHSASTNAEALMLPRLVGETGLGVFAGASVLATRLGAVPEGLAAALSPAVAKAEHSRTGASVVTVKRFLLLGVIACLGLACVVTLLAEPLAALLMPAHPVTGARIMRITIWLLPVMAALWVLGAALNGLNGDAAQAKAAGIAATINLGMTLVLVWKYGVMGACWSMVIRYIVWLLVFIPCSISTFKPVLRAARTTETAKPGPAVGVP